MDVYFILNEAEIPFLHKMENENRSAFNEKGRIYFYCLASFVMGFLILGNRPKISHFLGKNQVMGIY